MGTHRNRIVFALFIVQYRFLLVIYFCRIFVDYGFRDFVIRKTFEIGLLEKKQLRYHTRFRVDNVWAVALFFGGVHCCETLRTSSSFSNVVRNTFSEIEINRAFFASLSMKSGTPTGTNTLWHRVLGGLPRNLDLTIIAFYIIAAGIDNQFKNNMNQPNIDYLNVITRTM